MSRIGNRRLHIPAGVTVEVNDNNITVNGPKGKLDYTFDKLIEVKVEGEEVVCTRKNETKQAKSLHGTTNSLIKGMLTGVSDGFEKGLEIYGVGLSLIHI